MDDSLIKMAFSPERAEVYDQQFAALGAMKDLMHLILRVRFAELPPDARVLVVGAGTGQEVRVLAPLFPGWRFTLVDPSEGMLAVAERHATNEGFVERCAFHHGYLASLAEAPHDAATSILVSHFLTDADERGEFFEDIATRLKPGGLLFNADLSADREHPSFESQMDLWLRMIDFANRSHDGPTLIPADAEPSVDDTPKTPSYREMFGTKFAAHAPDEVESFIEQAGFRDITLCYQSVLVRAWCAERAG